jgi:hypothetical protein
MGGKIAVIGWGSLIWNPGVGAEKLNIDGLWRCDGPKLPVQFARISGGDRLTLVLLDEADPMTTYWAIHESSDPSKAKSNLGRREGNTKNPENVVDEVLSDGKAKTKNMETIQVWLKEKKIERAIWTNFSCNFEEKLEEKKYSEDKAAEYLHGLAKNNNIDCARTYITRTPPQSRNKFFKRVITEFNWTPEDDTYFAKFLDGGAK